MMPWQEHAVSKTLKVIPSDVLVGSQLAGLLCKLERACLDRESPLDSIRVYLWGPGMGFRLRALWCYSLRVWGLAA